MTSPFFFPLNNELVDIRGQDSEIDDVMGQDVSLRDNISLGPNNSLQENPAFGHRIHVSRSRDHFLIARGVTESGVSYSRREM